MLYEAITEFISSNRADHFYRKSTQTTFQGLSKDTPGELGNSRRKGTWAPETLRTQRAVVGSNTQNKGALGHTSTQRPEGHLGGLKLRQSRHLKRFIQ